MGNSSKMRGVVFLQLLCLSLYGAHSEAAVVSSDINTTEIVREVAPAIMVIEDKSGLSDEAVRERAKSEDTKRRQKTSVAEVVQAVDAQGNVDISKLQEKWEDLSPTPKQFDWIRTKSGEWFKGKIKGLYDDKLEFDSDEIGLYSFKFDDVVEIKSHQIINVNIENVATFPGIMRLKNNKVRIIQGEKSFDFDKKDIISFAPDSNNERNFWSGKVTLSFDFRKGNNNQYDYSAKINLMRRTATSRLSLDYLGRVSAKEQEQIADDHRLNEKYDSYLTKHFFWTPVFSEFFTDKYKNIDRQLTLGFGAGYTPIDTKKTTWSFSGGPAFLKTRYKTVGIGEQIEDASPALELSTKLEYEASEITDITYDYKLTYTEKSAGVYKHHMVLSFENEITKWLDIDVTSVWDYILEPTRSDTGILPEKSDFQLLVGLGIEF